MGAIFQSLGRTIIAGVVLVVILIAPSGVMGFVDKLRQRGTGGAGGTGASGADGTGDNEPAVKSGRAGRGQS